MLQAGFTLLPRLPVTPSYALSHGGRWLDETPLSGQGRASSTAARVRAASDGQGLARSHPWAAGLAETGRAASHAEASTSASPPQPLPLEQRQHRPHTPRVRPRHSWRVALSDRGELEGCRGPAEVSPGVQQLIGRVLDDGPELSADEIAALFESRGADFDAVCAAADSLRSRVSGDEVTYVVNRNINYTNVCTYKCGFCSFSKGKAADALRGAWPSCFLASLRQRSASMHWRRPLLGCCLWALPCYP